MALEKVVITYDAEIDAYKQKLGQLETAMKHAQKVEKEGADATVKNTETFASAAEKRKKLIDGETNNIKRLKDQIKLSFSTSEISSFNAAIKNSEERIKTLGGEVKKVDKSVNSFGSDTLNRLKNQVIAAFAVERIIEFGKESVLLAAKAEGVERAFKNLNKPNLLSQLRDATRGTLSDLELMSQAVKADRLGVPIQNFATYLRFAQQRARETGENVDYLVDAIVNGIGRQSVRVIDNLGISQVRVREEFRKTGNFAQAVTTIINEELAKQGRSADTNADKIDRLSAKWQNFKVTAGDALLAFAEGALRAGGSLDPLAIAAKVLRPDISTTGGNKSITPEPEKAVEKQVKTLERLQQTLANLKDDFQTTDVSSTLFKEIGKQIETLEAEIDRLTGKTAERDNKAAEAEAKRKKKEREDAEKENERLRLENRKNIAADEKQRLKDEDQILKDSLDALSRELKTEQDLKDEAAELEKKKLLQLEEDKNQIRQDALEGLSNLLVGFIDIQNQISRAQSNQEIQAIDEQSKAQLEALDIEQRKREGTYKAKTKLEKEFDAKRKAVETEAAKRQAEIRTEQAKRDKEAALIQAAINIALAVTAGLSKPAIPPFPSAIAAGIAGAVQLALIAAQPIPKFKRGGEVGGRPHSQGGTLIEAEKGEFFTSVEQTRKYKEALMAINSNRFDDYVLTNHVTPFLKKAKAKKSQQDSEVFSNLAESLKLNGFDDYNIVRGLRPLRHVATSEDINRLIQTMSRNYR